MDTTIGHTSVFAMRMRLHQMVSEGILGVEVLNQLILDGELVTYERELWDFKAELPMPSTKLKPTEEEKLNYEAKVCEIVKDVVSFYNSFGGYLVIGVSDVTKDFLGWGGAAFSCDELNKKIKKYIKEDIETHYSNVLYNHKGKDFEIGILYIPQRPDSRDAVQFKMDATASSNGKHAFKRNDIYFRSNDECRAAVSPEDYAFLCAGGRRKFNATEGGSYSKTLLNNLGPRDPGFIEFIGRENYLKKLWIWLLDIYEPVKLLAGLGGVGKTAIAREFVETLAHTPPAGFEKIIWLSAKKQFYTAILGKFTPVTRIDFDDVPSLLKALLRELDVLDDILAAEDDRRVLIAAVIDALRILPAFIIIDDIDSLNTNDQQDVFHAIILILSQTTSSARASRAILTARLDLGAAPGQFFRVEGLEYKEFEEFVKLTAAGLELSLDLFKKDAKLLKRFRDTSSGSPTFCSSILRLVSLGENLDQALSKWKGADGEEVRNFAFKKEVDALSDIDARAFYAMIILGESSLIELTIILGSNETAIRDTISTLRKYHLVSIGGVELPGGTSIQVPSDIRLMQNVVKDRVSNFSQIERACAKARSNAPRVDDPELGQLINRVVAFWNANKPNEARELALYLVSKYKNNAELFCLLGRAYLEATPPNFVEADRNFRLASSGGCSRPELAGFWIDSKIAQNDWQGVLEITDMYRSDIKAPDRLFFRGTAFQQLAEDALRLGNFASAASNLQLGADEIAAGFVLKEAKGKVEELRVLKSDLFTQLIKVVEKTAVDADKYIDVWLVVTKAYDSYVRAPHLVRLGIARLMGWWDAVERRSRYDSSTETLGRKQVTKILSMIPDMNDSAQRLYIEAAVADLDRRITEYASAREQ